MHVSIRYSVTALMVLFLLQESATAQTLTASVTVNLDQLYLEKRMELQNLDRVIQQYVETHKWTNGDIPFELDINISVVIDKVRPSFEDVYSARMFIACITTGFKDVDKEWRFTYDPDQPLLFDPSIFNSFTSLLDFYIYIIIGEYLDRFQVYGGQQMFTKARTITRLGQADRYNRWWDRRELKIESFLRNSHKPFRAMTEAFYSALYWHENNNPEEKKLAGDDAMALLKKAAHDTGEEEFLKDFFRREYTNLAAVFSADTNHYALLMQLDPERKDFYTSFKNAPK